MVAPPGTHSGLSEGRRGRDLGRWGVCLPRLGGCGTDSGPCGLGGRGALLLGAGRWVGEGCLPLSPTPSPCSPLVLGPPALACLHCLQSRWPRSAQNSSRGLPRTECPSSARCLLSRVGVTPMAGGGGRWTQCPQRAESLYLPIALERATAWKWEQESPGDDRRTETGRERGHVGRQLGRRVGSPRSVS